MVAPASAGARFRQRKISVKLTLNIYKQNELPDLEVEQLRNVHEIESGVDKAEETEEHLQKVILAAEAAVNGQKVDQVYIPTPDASKHWDEAPKYYKGTFVEPASYIKFSATVEDTCGSQYNMDEEDEEFLIELNKEFPKKPLTETEFEIICERFENVINEKQPFLTIDPESIFSYEELKEYSLSTSGTSPEDVSRKLEEELNIHPFVTLFDCKENKPPRKLANLLNIYGEKVYTHWKTRRIRRLGKPVFPALKFEDPSEKNDNDPYVCFRRREFRQARKTRRTDTQGSERLRRLQKELRSIRELVFMCAQREVKRLEALKVERNIFKLRCDVKNVKRELNIPGEEEDLIAHKKKKVVPPEPKKEEVKEKVKLGRPKLHELNPNQEISVKGEDQRKPTVNPVAAQPYVKIPASKIPDIDLVTVQAVLNEKESAIARAVYEKLKTRKELDHGWINLTDDSNNPLFELDQPLVRIVEKNHIPFSSIATSLYEVKSSHYIDPLISDAIRHKRVLPGSKSFRASNGEVVDSATPDYYQLISNPTSSLSRPIMQLRKRRGRGNLTYIDRKFNDLYNEMDQYLTFSDSDEDAMDDDSEELNSLILQDIVEPPLKKSRIKNVYDSSSDMLQRWKSKWLFDNESSREVAVDPSRLNNISSQTQSIRFGSMILTKSLQNLQQQHRNHLQQQQQQQLQQQQQQLLQQLLVQLQQQQQQKKNGSLSNGHAGVNGSTTKVKHSNSQKPAGSGVSASPSNGSTPSKRRKSTVTQKNGSTPNSTNIPNNKGGQINSTSTSATPTNGSNIRTGISTG